MCDTREMHYLNIPPVILAAASGAIVGDNLGLPPYQSTKRQP
jgi:hypothetical protein